MTLLVNVDYNNFFSQYIQILNPLFNLRKREAEILESFLRVHYHNRHLPNVNQLLFSLSTLRQIRESHHMSIASFNNHRMMLRKKRVLIANSLNPIFTKNYPVKGELEITFKLDTNKANDNNNKGHNRQAGQKVQSLT